MEIRRSNLRFKASAHASPQSNTLTQELRGYCAWQRNADR
jgi:hypothetical protein